MKLKIQFKLTGNKQLMPLNNQYPISAWIYKVLNKADKEFANMLHENGYKTKNGKQFKLFTFSKLKFPKNTWKIIPKSDRMQIWSRKAYLTISFQLPEQTEKFVTGLFKEQKVFIGDKNSGIEMDVENIEALKQDAIIGQNLQEKHDFVSVKLKSETAIVLGIDIENEDNEQYVTPLHPEYKRIFLKNLLDKNETIGGENVDITNLDFKVGKISAKTTMQTIKAFTDAETKVRGYNYEFELIAPKNIVELGLNAGFGSMNSLGFGFCGLTELT